MGHTPYGYSIENGCAICSTLHSRKSVPAKWQPGEETLKPSLDLVGML